MWFTVARTVLKLLAGSTEIMPMESQLGSFVVVDKHIPWFNTALRQSPKEDGMDGWVI